MPTYNTNISRDASDDPLVPTPVSAQIIQEMPSQSAALQRFRHVNMSTKTQRMPVLDVLPMAYWVSGDTGRKQTTTQDWKNVNLIVEELAAIVPIPEAYLDDSQVPIWDEVRPRLVEALGEKIDAATLFGTGKPSTWGNSVYEQAVAAGNTVAENTGVDFAQDVTLLGEMIAQDGYAVNGFASRPGLGWKLTGLRNANGTPVYQPNLQGGAPGGTLYGYGLSEVLNGSWESDQAQLIGGDWSKGIIGMRQDITFKLFTEGVISDDAGAIVLNLMQQDAVALRVVMRLAFAVANPVTALSGGADLAHRSAFGVVTTAAAEDSSSSSS